MTFSIRNYRDSDFSTVLAAINASSAADGESYHPSEADLRARLNGPHWNPAQDFFVAETPGAGIVACAEGVPHGASGERLYRTRGFVHPDFRRQGVGRALLERQWARAKELSAYYGGAKAILAAAAYENQAGAIALFESFSMRRVRYFLQMHCDLSAPLPPVSAPPGLRLRPWAERRDERAVWAASPKPSPITGCT